MLLDNPGEVVTREELKSKLGLLTRCDLRRGFEFRSQEVARRG